MYTTCTELHVWKRITCMYVYCTTCTCTCLLQVSAIRRKKGSHYFTGLEKEDKKLRNTSNGGHQRYTVSINWAIPLIIIIIIWQVSVCMVGILIHRVPYTCTCVCDGVKDSRFSISIDIFTPTNILRPLRNDTCTCTTALVLNCTR